MKNNIKLFLVLISLVFLFTACEQLGFKVRGIKYSNGLIEVIGNNTITSAMTINPGTTVRFEDVTSLFAGGGDSGALEIKDGGKLIAQGTASNPIIIETKSGQGPGYIYLRSNATNDSVMEYCSIGASTVIQIENNATIQKCKFNDGRIIVLSNSQSLMQYNTFNKTSTLSGTNISIGDTSASDASPLIYYNNIIGGGGNGIGLSFNGTPDIRYNNITNKSEEAIFYYNENLSSITIQGNYIADCNGKSGADTTGNQSYNVIYTNPLTVAVSSAGCGW
jgi:hypothetical protein